jgi:ribosomal protein S18 acetylase RimI-like enzyme
MPTEIVKELPSRDRLNALFCRYPFKQYQQRIQGINKTALGEFFASQLGANRPDSLVLGTSKSRELRGLGAISASPWQSRQFGIPMGRIQPIVFLPESGAERALGSAPGSDCVEFVRSCQDEARRLGFVHVTCRVDGADWGLAHGLESSGFRLVDCSIKMSLDLQDWTPGRKSVSSGATLEIRDFAPGEEAALRGLAQRNHQHNPLFADPWLKRDAVCVLFGAWVDRCLSGPARHAHVAWIEGKPAGFVIYLENRAFNEALGLRIAVLDFMVLDAAWQGRGLGRRMLDASLERLGDEYRLVELRTSHVNLPALALYTRAGFRAVGTDLRFHAWVGG